MKHGGAVVPEFFDPNQDFLGTKGLVFVGDKVLVYRRDAHAPSHAGELDVPGGGREGGESPMDTFGRETREEFGLKITKASVVWARAYPNTLDPTKIAYYAVAHLPAEMAEQIRFGDEGEAYYLMPLGDYLDAPDAWDAYQNRARDYARFGGLV
jgi:8-oxo-dGTP diphosphatase